MKAIKPLQSYSAPAVRRYAYPGAAEPRYFAEKLNEGITALLTGMGAVTVFVLLITL